MIPVSQGPARARRDVFIGHHRPLVLSFIALILATYPSLCQTAGPAGSSGCVPEAASCAASVPVALRSAATGDVLHIVVGHSMLLTSAARLRRVYVGNPAVLQTYTSGSDEVVLTAQKRRRQQHGDMGRDGRPPTLYGLCGHRSRGSARIARGGLSRLLDSCGSGRGQDLSHRVGGDRRRVRRRGEDGVAVFRRMWSTPSAWSRCTASRCN